MSVETPVIGATSISMAGIVQCAVRFPDFLPVAQSVSTAPELQSYRDAP